MTDEWHEKNADDLAAELMGEIDQLFTTDLDADETRPVAKMPHETPWCLHKRTRLAGESRRVYCRDCGREVPAFDVLSQLARDWETYMHTRQQAQARAKTASANLVELLRLERNAKSRLRNAMKKAPRCSCTEEQRTNDTKRVGAWAFNLPKLWRSELPWCPRCGGRW